MAPSSEPSDETMHNEKGALQRYYRLLDTRFFLSCPRCLEDLLHPVLAHLEIQEIPSVNVHLTITRSRREWRVLQGAMVLGKCRDLEELAPLVHGILASLALRT